MGARENAHLGHAGAMDGLVGQPRIGLVTSVNADGSLVRVTIQPEGTLTGWLPVPALSIGSGMGVHIPLWQGAQVVVIPDTGASDHGIVLCATYNDEDPPPSAPSTIGGASTPAQPGKELLVTGAAGQVLRMCEDGTIYMRGTLVLEGDLHASGEVIRGFGTSDQNGLGTHKHPTAEPGAPSSPEPNT